MSFNDPMGDKETAQQDYSNQWNEIINNLLNNDLGFGGTWTPQSAASGGGGDYNYFEDDVSAAVMW